MELWSLKCIYRDDPIPIGTDRREIARGQPPMKHTHVVLYIVGGSSFSRRTMKSAEIIAFVFFIAITYLLHTVIIYSFESAACMSQASIK